MLRILRWLAMVLAGLAALLIGLALLNGSFWSDYKAPTTLLAHRGLHQTYNREDLERDTCSSTRIHAPEHNYLENTLTSMQAAFDLGADIVEFDVHPTTDGQFAVFHDWTIDCRTEGKGVTREQSMSYLKTLDIGYGYTADGGKTFPFRGKGVGLMPTLDEVLAAFPDKRFLINIKSNYANEGKLLAARLGHLPPKQLSRLWAYGGDRPIKEIQKLIPGFRAMSRQSLTRCVLRYLAIGWSGAIPDACRNTFVMVPSNLAPLLWGWPNLFIERMAKIGTPVFVRGDLERGFEGAAGGIDDLAAAEQYKRDFPGGIWTDRIDLIAPYFGRKPRR